jgi:uncharacterized phage protein (TIGR02220 family)
MYRISDKAKWNDYRFRKLTVLEKAVYCFLWDNVDVAGFYKISDPESDATKINCSMDDYRSALKSLCEPKEGFGGEKHRGFVIKKSIVWITHFIKHDQQGSFGNTMNNAHVPIVKILNSNWTVFADEPEYMQVLALVPSEMWKKAGIINPLIGYKEPSFEARPAPKMNGQQLINDIYSAYHRITKQEAVMSEVYNKMLRDLISEGHTLKDFEMVFELKKKQWDTPDKKQFLTMKTLLKPGNFPSFLEEARNVKKEVGYVMKKRV